ncbi:Hypothetical protein PHPALM_14506 [Phytophthora palmivora]|uniref:Reverse transcriptase n=1 Tax=Phytophthora palmivora TaxID=4796 RepID=A0A2P4XUL9_9STRA|nr:Hypothetical protein PHPALM_14506 [Phytophthora palmivora]
MLAEQVERMEAFDTYERELIAQYRGWAYTREATSPGCFPIWAQLCQQLGAAFHPANYGYRQRSRFLASTEEKRELHEHIQEMRVLAVSLVVNPLPEHVKMTVFMDGLEVRLSRTQLFRVHANTMEEAIQIALQEGTATDRLVPLRRSGKTTMRRQAQSKVFQQLGLAQPSTHGTGALDRIDRYYQILMRESDIPLTAVSTSSGMLWEWLVMPQGLSNAPATFDRLVTQLFRPLRTFAQTYLDDIFVHSRAEGGQTAMEVHLKPLRRVFEVMRANKLYANIDKCVFAAEEINVLGCFGSRIGVRADPGKVKAIAAWPTPRSQKDLRKWLGLANYLHKYSAGYAELARPLSDLLNKDADWVWERQHQDAFDSIKASSQHATVLALPDETKPFSVVWDASDYAIGCALLQKDVNVVHLLGTRPFVIYTDHASVRTATNSPHLSQRMARWLSFFAEYNFRVEYKPGKLNVLADA